MPARQMDAVIVGAGVTGLAIALELTNRGHKVGIVAKDLPEDSESVGFASPWAGCNWCSFADNDKREQEWDRKTYKALFRVAKEHPELCELIPFYSYEKASSPEPWFREIVRDYSVIDQPSSSSSPDQRLISYKSFIIHAPRYLCHLAGILRSKGVQIIRKRLNSVQEAYTLPEFGRTSIVINATGLGARSILGSSSASSSSSGGGERKKTAEEVIYPIRGQTVLVHAPGVKTCYMKTQDHPDASTTKDTEIPEPVYIIPRPGKEEHVVLGGSFQVNNWEYTPDFKLAERILQRTYELCPALAGPNGTSWRDIKIVSHNVGFRPGRAGGARLDLEELDIADAIHLAPASSYSKPKKGKVACIQAYGIGPAGYQASVGYAHEAADMCEEWLAKNKSAQAKL